MEIYKPSSKIETGSIGENSYTPEFSEKDSTTMENFYRKYLKQVGRKGSRRISLETLLELKERGIATENFLDYLCQQHGVLLHGSIHEIPGGTLRSSQGKIFASNRSAIALMRSLYSNANVNVRYPYFITEKNPMLLEVHTPPDGKFTKTDKGYIYIVDAAGFRNEPKGSWQFIKEADEVDFGAVVETESGDFKYPVQFFNDLAQKDTE